MVKVQILTTPGCAGCAEVKKMLDAMKIKYEVIDIVKNPNYESVPEIKKIRVREYPEFGLVKNRPLYSLVNNLEKLKFLNYS